MTVVPDPVPEIQLTLYQGDTWDSPIFTHVDNDSGDPIDFTGKEIRGSIRYGYGADPVVITFDTANGDAVIIDPAAGKWRMSVGSDITSDLLLNGEQKVCVFDVELYEAGAPEYVRKILRGTVVLKPEVTTP